MQEQKLLIEQPTDQEHSIETEEPQLLEQVFERPTSA
jgi:hypothetical protein